MINDIVQYFVKRKRATLFVLALILLYGFAAYRSIPKESSPDINIPYLYVYTNYEGISAEDSEKLLTKPLENELRDIEGVKQLTSYSSESTSSIVLEFEAGFDSDKALDDVRAKVSQAKSKLPSDADEPIIKEINIGLFPVLNIFLSGELPQRTLKRFAEDIQDKLEALPEVLEAKISGLDEEVIEIIIEPKVIENYSLSMSQLQAVISRNNKLIAAGVLRTKTGDFAIKVPGLIYDYEELLEFPIKAEGDKVVRLKDIAEVRRAFKDPTSIVRVNGKNAIAIEVVKKTGENIIETIDKVKAIISAESVYWPQALRLTYSQDESFRIIDFVSDLENTIIIGVLLVMMVILVSVGPRSALLIALSIPTSFLAGIMLLDLSGVTLNIVVLFSLILTVGMIVDDAIVISELADRQMQMGHTPEEAFPYAAYRMFWPVFSSTIVKLIVFMPLLFWPNIIGQFMRFMPITVITVLTNSLLYAILFQPSLGILLGKPKSYSHNIKEDATTLDVKSLEPFRRHYALILLKVLESPKKFILIIMGLLVGVYIFFAVMGPGSQFFPSIEPDNAYITVQSQDNLSIFEVNNKLKEIEELLLPDLSEIKVMYSRAGKLSSGNDQFPNNTVGYILLEFTEWNLRRKASVILEEIREKLKEIRGVNIEIIEEKKGPTSAKPIRLDLTCRNFAEADKAADAIRKFMEDDPQFKAIEDSRSTREIEWELHIDRIRAAIFAADLNAIGASVRLVTNGFLLSTFTPEDSDDEIDVVLRFPPSFRKLSMLDRITIETSQGAIPLNQIITLTPNIKVSELKRVDRRRVVTLTSDVMDGVLVNNKIMQLKNFIEQQKFQLVGVQVDFLGDDKEQQETGSFLSQAFMLTLVMMFLVMLIQFNSYYHTIVVMSAVFLSSVGVLIAHIITWQPFGIVMSGVGIIALGGIVLNNNILYIDTYQRMRELGVPLYDAVVLAGVERLRPILLTAFTAVLGLMPMVLGLTINLFERTITFDAPASQWWRQLSASIAGGLTFATVLTLFFTPCLLIIGKRFDKEMKKK